LSETDSFIEEVTEEVRRDKLFALYRKYGWIVGVIVVGIVGAAAYNEYRNYRQTEAARAFGDQIMVAMSNQNVDKRAEAIAKVPADDAAAKPFLALLQAAVGAESTDHAAALVLLDRVAAAPDTPDIYRSLAELKAVILRGADQDRSKRLAILDKLATPGNPFRVIAMEQKALALVEFGNNDKAIKLLLSILEEPGATQDLRDRTQRLIVALGGTLPKNPAAPVTTSNG